MGHHFIPQRYLRNFEDTSRPGFIWVHDKRKGEIRQAAIDQVAQSKNFYRETTESLLAQEVEAPGNEVMRKLINDAQINFGERKILAYYVGVMLKRVPAARKRAKDMMPTALDGLVAEIREQFNSLAKDPRTTPELLARRHRELDEVAAKFSREPPLEALEQFREPWPSAEWFDGFLRMTWRILVTEGPAFFATSDNPVFFFEEIGLAGKLAEVSFPLSTTHALHASWQPGKSDLIFLRPEQLIVKEMNRRLAGTAERLAFYHEDGSWLLKLLSKERPRLSTIEWKR